MGEKENRTMRARAAQWLCACDAMGIIFHLLEFRSATRSPVPFFPTHVHHRKYFPVAFFFCFAPLLILVCGRDMQVEQSVCDGGAITRCANRKMPNRNVRLLLFIRRVFRQHQEDVRGKCGALGNARPAFVSFRIIFLFFSCLYSIRLCVWHGEGCRFG